MSVVRYKPKFVIVYLFTLITIHTGPSTCDSRQTTNYFLHNIHNSLTNHNSFCPLALPGVLGCGRGALEWARQSMLCSLTSPLLSLGATLSLFPFHPHSSYDIGPTPTFINPSFCIVVVDASRKQRYVDDAISTWMSSGCCPGVQCRLRGVRRSALNSSWSWIVMCYRVVIDTAGAPVWLRRNNMSTRLWRRSLKHSHVCSVICQRFTHRSLIRKAACLSRGYSFVKTSAGNWFE